MKIFIDSKRINLYNDMINLGKGKGDDKKKGGDGDGNKKKVKPEIHYDKLGIPLEIVIPDHMIKLNSDETYTVIENSNSN
jgi:hypothetical protein